MAQPALLVRGWLLAALLAGGLAVGGAVGFAGADAFAVPDGSPDVEGPPGGMPLNSAQLGVGPLVRSTGDSPPALAGDSAVLGNDSATALRLRIEPGGRMLDENEPTSFTVMVANPEDGGERHAFLAVGVTPPTQDVGLEVEDQRPWFLDEGKFQWAETVRLRPGESRSFGVTVGPQSVPGEYELNATISYVGATGYTKTWDTAGLTVRSCRSLTGLVACNWQWLLALAGVVVSLLSFLGYRRVRGGAGRVFSGDGGGER